MKLLVTDYDGTFLIDEVSLKKNIKAVNKLRKLGFKFIISTGRSFSSIKKQVELHNIPYDYLHCADGACVFDNNDNLLNFYEMDHQILDELMNLIKNVNYEEIQICYPKTYEDTYNKNDKIAGVNIVFRGENYSPQFEKDFLKLKEKYPNYNFLIYDHITYVYLCIKAPNICKSAAIKFMEEKYNIDPKDIYVIGDSDNDIEMVRDYKGVSIMGKNDEIKEYSKKQYNHVYEYISDIIKDVSD